MSSIAIAVAIMFVVVLAAAAIIAIQLLGGWSSVRVRWKLWSWRRRLHTVDDYLAGLDGELQDVDREDVYQQLDRSYPGTLEAKREQLVAERDYLQARIDAIERDRDARTRLQDAERV